MGQRLVWYSSLNSEMSKLKNKNHADAERGNGAPTLDGQPLQIRREGGGCAQPLRVVGRPAPTCREDGARDTRIWQGGTGLDWDGLQQPSALDLALPEKWAALAKEVRMYNYTCTIIHVRMYIMVYIYIIPWLSKLTNQIVQ